ncbi:MAG: TonB-dependent receptor [Gammaproteobacteria bacterium]|nr:TonB-dependent receptor [Gammaproteobacteria bacterium]
MAVAVSSMVPSHFAVAQADGAARAAGLEEIVVTAQRRQSTVQDVGAAISVLSADVIDRAQIRDTQDLPLLVPGIVVSRDIGLTTQIFVRGIGNNLLGVGAQNSVATYVDGVYLPNSVQVFQNFVDVERIEVLKGPQAVLYGRNATGGALLVQSAAPEFDSSVRGDVSVGNYGLLKGRITATGSLSDRVAARVSAQYSDRDGYSTNLANGRDQDFEEIRAVRGEILFQATDMLSVSFAGDYADIKAGEFKKAVNRDNWLYNLSSPDQFSPDPRGRFQQFDSSQPATDAGLRASINWSASWGDLTSVTSYRNFDVGPVFFDNDSVGEPFLLLGMPFQIAFIGSEIESKQWYHESFVATPSDSRLRAVAGFNLFKEDTTDFSNRWVGFSIARNDRELSADGYAVYADLMYDVVPSVTLIAGARYSRETKSYAQTTLDVQTNAPLAFAENRGTWSEVTPRFGIEYRPMETTLVYGTATQGFKSGGFNEANPLNKFDPEKIWAYEAGVKHDWSPRLRTNLSAFYYDYSDLQVQQIIIPDFTRLIRNAAAATIRGVDLEVVARPHDDLAVSLNLGYLDSKYGDFEVCIDLFGPCTIPGPDGGQILNPVSNVNVKGNQLANAPKLTGSITADYVLPVRPANGELRLHLNASYRSNMYFTPYETEIHKSDSYWLLGAELRYDSPAENWFVSAYGQNLSNELYETWIANVARFLGPADGAPRYVAWGAPRTYGLRAGFRF